MRHKIYLIAIMFVFLLSTSNPCSPKYVKTIPIRVVDYNYRPVENAYVSIYYQLTSSVTDEGKPKYTSTKKYPTNSSGMVEITIRNLETNPSRVDCNIKINVSLFNYETEEEVNIDEMPKTILIKIPAKRLTINIYDQNLNPLEGRAIIGDESIEVNGSKSLFVPKGKLNVLVIHNFRKKSYDLNIKEDTTLTSIFEYQDISINVMDEKGNLLPFKLVNHGEEVEAIGHVNLRIPAGITEVEVHVAGEKRVVDIDTSKKQVYNIFIDRSAPKVYALDIKQNDYETVIDLVSEDEGKYASGVKKIYGKLLFDDGTVIEKEFINLEGDNYEFGVQKSGSFQFTITAYDKENNILILKGRHEITYEDNPVEIEEEGDLLPYIIGILVIGLIGGAIYVKKKLQEMEEL